jgi:DNA-binding transcriptional ArsR family regulator
MKFRRDIFQALADPTRRAILIFLASQTASAGAIASQFNAARSTVSKHIQILTECGIVAAAPKGREIYYQIKIDRMKEIDLWLDQIRVIWEARFDKLDNYLIKIQKNKNHGKNSR